MAFAPSGLCPKPQNCRLLPKKRKANMEKYNINNLNNFLEIERSPQEVCKWFDAMARDYKTEKQNMSEKDMFNLYDFWKSIQFHYGTSIYDLLREHWEGEKVEMIKDFHEFSKRYNEIKYQNIYLRMDEIEQSETEALIEEIWNKNERVELSFSYYDYYLDLFQNFSMNIPRLDRDQYKDEFKTICANVILNRGNLLTKIYCQRGLVQYAAVKVNEHGRWRCLSESEIETSYSDNNNNPLKMGENQRVISFNHASQSDTGEYKKLFYPNFS